MPEDVKQPSAVPETGAEKARDVVDKVRAWVDEGANVAEEVASLIPSLGAAVKLAIVGLKNVIDVADDTVDAIVK